MASEALDPKMEAQLEETRRQVEALRAELLEDDEGALAPRPPLPAPQIPSEPNPAAIDPRRMVAMTPRSPDPFRPDARHLPRLPLPQTARTTTMSSLTPWTRPRRFGRPSRCRRPRGVHATAPESRA